MSNFRHIVVTAAALVAVVATVGLAEQVRLSASETEFSDYDLRLAELEAEMQILRATHSRSGRKPCGRCGDRCNCRPSHFDVGAEVAFLSPHSTTGLGPSGSAFFPSTGMSPSWRTWLSYTGSNGLGLRARYWEFDHHITNNLNIFTYDLDAFTIDLEVTYSKLIGGDWDVLLSGGVRHFGFNEVRTFLSPSTVDSDLTGVVIGGELKRNLIGGLRGYGVTRGSAVFGDLEGEVPPGFVVVLENRHAVMWEAQLGLEYCRETSLGALSLRLGAEVMHWDSVSYKRIAGTVSADESVGMVGIVTGFTLRR